MQIHSTILPVKPTFTLRARSKASERRERERDLSVGSERDLSVGASQTEDAGQPTNTVYCTVDCFNPLAGPSLPSGGRLLK